MSYELRDLELDKDRSFLVEILEKNLNFQHGADNVINWNNITSKYPAECMILEHYDDDNKSQRIGNICTFYRDFNYLGKKFKVGIFGNLVIDEKHRSLQPALKLTKGNAQKSVANLPFIYVFPNEKAIGVFKLSGFKQVGVLVRYAYINGYNQFLGEKLPVIGNIAGTAIDLLKNLFSSIRYSIIANGYISEVEGFFPDDINILFKKSILSKLICNYRDREYMSWRYLDNPEYDFTIINSYKFTSSGKTLIAICVFNIEDNVLFIRDLIFDNNKSFCVVIGAVKKWAIKNDIKSISIRYMGTPVLIDLLKSSGFHARESGRVVVTKSNSSRMLEELTNSNNWYILDGDEDI